MTAPPAPAVLRLSISMIAQSLRCGKVRPGTSDDSSIGNTACTGRVYRSAACLRSGMDEHENESDEA
jgi:hypothetical protein